MCVYVYVCVYIYIYIHMLTVAFGCWSALRLQGLRAARPGKNVQRTYMQRHSGTYIYIYIYIHTHMYLSLSLSLYIYIYGLYTPALSIFAESLEMPALSSSVFACIFVCCLVGLVCCMCFMCMVRLYQYYHYH